MNRKILVQDDDCHWYLIDESVKETFLKWVEDIYNEKKYEIDFNECATNSYQNVKILDYDWNYHKKKGDRIKRIIIKLLKTK